MQRRDTLERCQDHKEKLHCKTRGKERRRDSYKGWNLENDWLSTLIHTLRVMGSLMALWAISVDRTIYNVFWLPEFVITDFPWFQCLFLVRLESSAQTPEKSHTWTMKLPRCKHAKQFDVQTPTGSDHVATVRLPYVQTDLFFFCLSQRCLFTGMIHGICM